MAICRKKQGNKVYLQEYKNVRVKGKVKHIFVKHLGVDGEDGKPIRKPRHMLDNLGFSKTRFYGATSLLWNLCEEINLEKTINENIAHKEGFSVGKLLIALVINKIIKPLRFRKIEEWTQRTNIPELMQEPNSVFAKHNLLRALDAIIGTQQNLDYDYTLKIEKAIFEQQNIIPKKIFSTILYDTTSTFYHGETCELAEFGYNSKKIKQKQIKIGLCVTKQHHIPIFHFPTKGSVMDTLTNKKVAQLITDFNIPKPLVMWDRGVTSLDIIRWAEENNTHIIAGIKNNLREVKDLLQTEIEETTDNFIKKSEGGAIYAIAKEYTFFNKKINIIIYKNAKKALHTRTERHENISQAIETLKTLKYNDKKLKNKIKDTIKNVKPYITIKYTTKGFTYTINEKNIKEDEKKDGKYAIICTDLTFSKKEAIQTYFQKNNIEQSFKILKHELDMNTIYHHLPNRVKAYYFVCFLSYYLYSILEYRIKQANIEQSFNEVIDKLHHIEKLELKYGKQKKNILLNVGEQETEILKKLKMSHLIQQEPIIRPNL